MPRVIAQVATAATTEVPVNATAYTEQTSGAQRSIKSSSASDAAAGVGARKVRLYYYTLTAAGVIAGPFHEDLTLNGTTFVATVATNIALVERMDVLTVGSTGVPVGAVTLYDDAAGAGSAICSIAAGAVRTLLGHHYVATGRLCSVTDLEVSSGDAGGVLVRVVAQAYPRSGVPEQPVTGSYGATLTLPRGVAFAGAMSAPIPGPARVRLLVEPANTNSQTTRASFGYVDQVGSY